MSQKRNPSDGERTRVLLSSIVAAALAAYGRANNKRTLDLTFEEFTAVYRTAMNPQSMIPNRKGIGGPQPAEFNRMLSVHRRNLETLNARPADRRAAIAAANHKLEAAFAAN